jgi:hypothetical protein
MALISSQKSFIKAAHTGDIREIRYCLSHVIPSGFSKNARDKEGKTALYHAAEQGHTDIVKLLLRYDADTSIAAPDGATPLMAAIRAQRTKSVIALLDNGANPDAHDNDYTYPLHNAAFQGDLDSVKALIKAKAALDLRIRANSRTALHWAVDKGYADIVAALLEAGADTTLPDNANNTPMDVARKKNRMHVIQLLEQARQKRDAAPEPAALQQAPARKTPEDGIRADVQEEWVLTGGSRVTHVGRYPEINRRLTEIFNFESRERLVIAENLKTGAESMTPPESFDAISEDALVKAFAAYQKLGGAAATEDHVFRRRLMKTALKK